jgi:hypothetical protein
MADLRYPSVLASPPLLTNRRRPVLVLVLVAEDAR